MNSLMTLVFLELFVHDTTAVTHSLKYFYTSSSEVPEFPEFVSVGLVDDTEIDYYDSETQCPILKQDWMSRVTNEDHGYVKSNTKIYKKDQQWLKDSLKKAMNHFNQTTGVHTLQVIYGCDWNNETDTFNSYELYGLDGDNFRTLNIEKMDYRYAKQHANGLRLEGDDDEKEVKDFKHYLTVRCINWLRMYVRYGESSLMRTDLPSVSLLQKSPSSPITCHATGFYPNSAVMFWRKDGKKLDNVHHGEIIPNHDGSFQMSADLLRLPSDDWGSYECVFQFTEVEGNRVTKLSKDVIRTNYKDYTKMIFIGIAVAFAIQVIIAVVGIHFCRTKKSNCDASSENTLELTVKLNQSQ